MQNFASCSHKNQSHIKIFVHCGLKKPKVANLRLIREKGGCFSHTVCVKRVSREFLLQQSQVIKAPSWKAKISVLYPQNPLHTNKLVHCWQQQTQMTNLTLFREKSGCFSHTVCVKWVSRKFFVLTVASLKISNEEFKTLRPVATKTVPCQEIRPLWPAIFCFKSRRSKRLQRKMQKKSFRSHKNSPIPTNSPLLPAIGSDEQFVAYLREKWMFQPYSACQS